MTDVVKIAMDRRAALTAEVARLDKFIRMAEALVKLDQDGQGAALMGAHDLSPSDLAPSDLAPGEPGADHGSEAATAGKSNQAVNVQNDAAPVLFQFNPFRKVAPAPANSDARDLNDEPSADETVLLLSDPLPKEEAVLDVHIGQKMRQRRWMMGMSGEQLGDRIGVGLDQIKAYEAGSVHIGSGRMWEIASAMEVPMSYFFEDIEGQAPDTGEARSEILTDKEALVLVRDDSEIRTAQAS